MDQERERIQEDLRGLVEGEVRCDDVFVQMYASDASIYSLRPLGVVRPRGVSDVVACVQYAADQGIPVHPRGAGTGVAGESLGSGIVLDFSHNMRRIVATDENTVRVQPGVVLAHLNRHLAEKRRCFGPDPATRSVTTMGSVVSLDAAGSHWLRYGSARQHVEELQVVLASGDSIRLGRHRVDDPAADREFPVRQRLVRRIAELITREQKIIDQHQPRSLVNRCGYRLHDVLSDGHLDLAKMFVGSEGTLGLITEATVKTEAVPKFRALALLFFERLDWAARAAGEIAGEGVAACDLMDRRLLTIAREIDVRYDLLIPQNAEAMLLVEEQGEDANEVGDRLRELVVRMVRHRRLAADSRVTMEKDERDFYWRLARRVVPTLYQLKGDERALPFIEDIAVPVDVLPDFLVTMQNVFKSHEVVASLFAHVGHGQLHARPFLDLSDPHHQRKMQDLAKDIYQRVLDVGGTISGEHAVGLSRTWFLRTQYGPLYDVFHEVKRIFDPQNILNPGKVVADAPQPLTKNMRPVQIENAAAAMHSKSKDDAATRAGAASDEPQSADTAVTVPLQLTWTERDMTYAARACNGCGRCRTLSPEERMCPIFRFAPREEASPRAKANLVRAVMTGQLNPEEITRDSLKSIADLCVNCHQCRLECPAAVDIPKLVLETKSQFVATNGLPPGDWYMARIDLLSALGTLFRPLANWSIANRQMRWLIDKIFGIAQGRKLPRFERRSFIRHAHRRKLTRPVRAGGRKVLYFVDIYANWHDAQLANALVDVMNHNAVSVYVHPEQLPSGMSAIAVGAVDQARRFAKHNVAILADAVRQGYHIVATEPAAVLALRHEYQNLLDGEDVRLVAENTSDACWYLLRMHQSGQLELNLNPINATLGYHQPCHLRASRIGQPGENLLRLIPGLQIHEIEKGCSGMAGAYGLRRQNYRSSLRAGWGLISAIRSPTIQAGTTECSACKIQMEQGTTKPTIHPLKLLAHSYGLMPEVADLLTTRGEDLVVT